MDHQAALLLKVENASELINRGCEPAAETQGDLAALLPRQAALCQSLPHGPKHLIWNY